MCRSNLAGHTRTRQALIRLLAATSVAASLSVVPAGASTTTLTISGSPSPSVQAGSIYYFQPGVEDSSVVSFSVQNKPGWATFSTANGRLSGTPSSAAVGTYTGIVITASDGTNSASLPAFSIKVVPAAPTISGTPATAVTAGSAYRFTPSASASFGTVYFSILNRPSWATFSAATGTLAGTPTNAEAGTYSDIVIRAYSYDQSADLSSPNASLPAFSITVAPGSDAVTLQWTRPTQNTDGTTLTNLAGYRISYGTAADALSQSVTIANPATTSYVLSDLSAGTWYFAVEAYNTAGTYSPASNLGSTTIP
jgi:hypothetical protein